MKIKKTKEISCPFCGLKIMQNRKSNRYICINSKCSNYRQELNVKDVTPHANSFFEVLSIYFPNDFEIDGIKCISMQNFICGLIEPVQAKQKIICSSFSEEQLLDIEANQSRYIKHNVLYWKGIPFKKNSPKFEFFITKAYNELFNNEGFKNFLMGAGEYPIFVDYREEKNKKYLITPNQHIKQLQRLYKMGIEKNLY